MSPLGSNGFTQFTRTLLEDTASAFSLTGELGPVKEDVDVQSTLISSLSLFSFSLSLYVLSSNVLKISVGVLVPVPLLFLASTRTEYSVYFSKFLNSY